MIRQYMGIATLVAAAGLSLPALAQDSVSSNLGGLPGDALSPWTESCAAYVVDLAPLTTSQGNVFGVAPILKASKMSSANFTALGSAVSISPDVLTNSTYTRASYAVWNTAGAGVGSQNIAPQSVSPTGQATRFAAAFTDFGTTDAGTSYNGIIGALVSFDPANPNRLFVDRRMAAVNSANPTADASSQLGGVAIDANGNTYYRADAFNVSGPNAVTGNNLFRTRLADRNCGVNNFVSAAATIDATDRMLVGSSTTHSVPSLIPASIAGGSGVIAGLNFTDQYVYGSLPGSLISTGAHIDLPGGHRGSMAMTDHLALGAGVYTLGLSTEDPITGNNTVINLTAVGANGAVVAAKGFQVPLTITDNADGFTVNYIDGVFASRHHTGATAFRGGVGTVAVGNDQAGRTLIGKTISEFGFTGDWVNQIVIGRYSNPNGPVEWTIAGYIDANTGRGKEILDENGVAIGTLAQLLDVTGGSPTGPSLSAPAIDSVGNVWFLASVELFDRLPGGGSDLDSALIRAIYNPATFSYELELVLELGTIIEGQNSGLEYRVDFLATAAGAGTPTPNSLWSSAMADKAWNNVPTAGLDTSDPITNGGLVISTSVTYDANQDGEFNNPTSSFFDPSLPADESYQIALYVGYYQDAPAPCPADFNGDGVVNFFDVLAYTTAFNNGDANADLAPPTGTLNFFDFLAFIAVFNAGCP